MKRFKHRQISLLVNPSDVRRSTYDLVRASLLIRTIAIVQIALLAARLPVDSNDVVQFKLVDAGNGFTPHRAASAASF